MFMRRVLITALASATLGLAGPALATPLPLAQQTGPDLDTKIYASGDNGIATTGTTVYGNTSPGAGHNVQFSGYSYYNPGDPSTAVGTNISITGGNGFAQVADSDWVNPTGGNPTPSQDNLMAVIMNPDPNFYEYEFSIQTLAGSASINVFYMLTSQPGLWILSGNSPLPDGNGDTQFIFNNNGDPSTAIDQILITSSSPIFHIKQNSIELTGMTPSVPEPATWGLMLLGFAGAGIALRRDRKRKPALMQIA
jgi:hypothetical protein